MNKARVVVLGASGFVGKRVVDALVQSEWAVPTAAYHKTSSTNPKVAAITVDATDEASLTLALQDADAVVNCVAGAAPTITEGARVLFSVASKLTAPPRIIYLSTMSVYGNASGDVDEEAPLIGGLGPYSSAKVAAEHFAAQYPLAVVLRPGCVYGPGSSQWSDRIARLLVSGRLGDLGGSGEGRCNLVYIDDLVAAILQVLLRPATDGHAFNLSMTAPPTWNQYLLHYAQALGISRPNRISNTRLKLETLFIAPAFRIAENLARIAGFSRNDRLPIIPPSLARLFGQSMLLKSGKAEKMLGLSWTPMPEGLSMATKYFRAHARMRM